MFDRSPPRSVSPRGVVYGVHLFSDCPSMVGTDRFWVFFVRRWTYAFWRLQWEEFYPPSGSETQESDICRMSKP